MTAQLSRTPTVAERLAEQLEAWDVQFVFGVIGDSAAPLVEAVTRRSRMRFIRFRSEEAAAFCASAYAKITGRLGVCLAEAGPGAVHLLNGVYDAYYDSVPLLALTGQSPEPELGTSYHQTTDQNLLFAPATYDSANAADPKQALELLSKAMRTACVARTAVHLSVPKDLQQLPLDRSPLAPPQGGLASVRPRFSIPADEVRAMADVLRAAERPLILYGRSARSYTRELLQLAQRLQAPLIHTLPAAGVLPHSEPSLLGVLGDAGVPPARMAMKEADVVLAVGTTWWPKDYVSADATVLQIDINPLRIGAGIHPRYALVGDARDALTELLGALPDEGVQQGGSWLKRMQQARDAWRDSVWEEEAVDGTGVHPAAVMKALSEAVPEEALITLDVGAHTLWFGAAFAPRKQEIVLSGMWRAMGFALPAALAGRVASPRRPILALTGDGGLAMSLAELGTAVQERLPVVVLVMNNQSLAMEAHAQREMGLEPAAVELHNPDFAALAKTFGAEGVRVERAEELGPTLSRCFQQDRTYLIDVPAAVVPPPELARKIKQAAVAVR